MENIQNDILYLKLLKEGSIYECVGVLISENEEFLELAFNAIEDKIIDEVKLKKKYIIERLKLN